MDSLQDVHQIRDTYSAYPAEMHGFFDGWLEAKRYTVQEVIGKGSYGVVCAALDNTTGEKVAIKKIQGVFDNVADATRILREIKLLRLLRHPDVVEIKHIMLPPDPRHFKDIYVVFELLESDLHTVIGANDDLTQDHHKVFLYQLLRGLNYIHACGVLHRDLKPKNILANSNCKIKICDFGLARPFLPEQGATPVYWTDYVATRWYRAPELCGCFYGKYSQAVDIWSLGCIFAEVLTGKSLFPGRDAVSQLHLITDLLGKPTQSVIDRINNPKARAFLNAMPAKPPRDFAAKFPMADPLARDLLYRLLAFDPSLRPTAAEALGHPYFTGLPSAACTDAVAVGAADFGFESQKLTEAQVRQLIFAEVLSYHPHMVSLYDQRVGRPYAPLGPDDFKLQFLMAEQQQQHLQQAAMASTCTARTTEVHYPSVSQASHQGPASSSGRWGSAHGAPSSSGAAASSSPMLALDGGMIMHQCGGADAAGHYYQHASPLSQQQQQSAGHHQHVHHYLPGGTTAAAALFPEILPPGGYGGLDSQGYSSSMDDYPTQSYVGIATQSYAAYSAGQMPLCTA